jgi:hypothetical protein
VLCAAVRGGNRWTTNRSRRRGETSHERRPYHVTKRTERRHLPKFRACETTLQNEELGLISAAHARTRPRPLPLPRPTTTLPFARHARAGDNSGPKVPAWDRAPRRQDRDAGRRAGARRTESGRSQRRFGWRPGGGRQCVVRHRCPRIRLLTTGLDASRLRLDFAAAVTYDDGMAAKRCRRHAASCQREDAFQQLLQRPRCRRRPLVSRA